MLTEGEHKEYNVLQMVCIIRVFTCIHCLRNKTSVLMFYRSLGVNELNHECAVVWYFKG